MTAVGRPSSRDKIVAAAVDLAKEVGPGHVSLDAVAHRAGVSKGGLLYNFPSKTKLLEAIVAYHLDKFEIALLEKTEKSGGKEDSVIAACVDLFEMDCKKGLPPASGISCSTGRKPRSSASRAQGQPPADRQDTRERLGQILRARRVPGARRTALPAPARHRRADGGRAQPRRREASRYREPRLHRSTPEAIA